MPPSESPPINEPPPFDNDRPAKHQAGWKIFVLLPLIVALLGVGYILWQGRAESVQEITYQQFVEKLKAGEIDRKLGVVLISKPGAIRIMEGHLLNPPTAKVRAPVALQDDRHVRTDLESQYGLVVTEKMESDSPWLRLFSR
jgi:hypothetical protein